VTLIQALVLGIVQGLTEFIPVSSSAHLVLVPWLLGWTFEPQAAFAFNVLVQLGTLVAVIVCFWRDGLSILSAAIGALRTRRWAEGRLAWLLILATLPAAAAGILLKDLVEQAFASPAASAAFLLVTATLLGLSEVLHRRLGERPPATLAAALATPEGGENGARDALEELRVADSLIIGLAQALALLPGISRSGSTIAAGLTRGLTRPQAARFSFLMSVPIMLGAGLVAASDLASLPNARELLPSLAAGFLSAALVGFLAIRWLLRFLARRSLWVFAAYCALAGLAGLTLNMTRSVQAATPPPIPPPLPRVATSPALETWVSRRVLAFRDSRPGSGYADLGFSVETLPPEAALQAAADGEVVLAVLALDPPTGWFGTPLGRLGISIVVHPGNPVRELSLMELRELLVGRTQSWQVLGNYSEVVQPVIPLTGDELRLAVQQAALEGERYTLASLLAPSPPAMISLVAEQPGALGLLPLPELTDEIRSLRIEGQLPTEQATEQGSYPLWVQIVAMAPAEPVGAVREWLGWLQSGPVSSNP
jgi:undecaprenyl-diphosphatase